MKSYVLMSKANGQLFEGYRVCLYDQFLREEVAGMKSGGKSWHFALTSGYDGWVIVHPKILPTYLDRKGEKYFKVLGEL